MYTRRFLKYLRPYKRVFILVNIAHVAVAGLALVPAYLLKVLIDRIVILGEIKILWYLIFVAGGAYSMIALLSGLKTYWGHIVAQRLTFDLRNNLYRHLQKLPLRFHDNQKTGRLIPRVLDDLSIIEEACHHGPEAFLTAFFLILGTSIILFNFSSKLALLSLSIIPFLFLFILKGWQLMHQDFRSLRRRVADLSDHLEDSFSGIRIIKSFLREEHETDRFKNTNLGHFQIRKRVIKKMSFFSPGAEFLNALALLVVLGYGGLLFFRGEITGGILAASFIYLRQFYAPLIQLAHINEFTAQFAASIERYFELIEVKPEVEEKSGAKILSCYQGKVEFDNVSFSYQKDEEVLKSVSFVAQPGEIVALVGPSGAGKSTLISLIPRFYEVVSGSIYVDGTDIREVILGSLRKNIGIVMQDDFLFSSSIGENIRYGKLDASGKEIVEAAKLANAHEFISLLPRQYETQIGQRGVKLSAGQRQRISIARALLKNPKILILDEPTSALDADSETLIKEAIERLLKGRTTLIIAHRLSTIRKANQILVLNEGEITERGTHEELISEGGLYSLLYQKQFGDFAAGMK